MVKKKGEKRKKRRIIRYKEKTEHIGVNKVQRTSR